MKKLLLSLFIMITLISCQDVESSKKEVVIEEALYEKFLEGLDVGAFNQLLLEESNKNVNEYYEKMLKHYSKSKEFFIECAIIAKNYPEYLREDCLSIKENYPELFERFVNSLNDQESTNEEIGKNYDNLYEAVSGFSPYKINDYRKNKLTKTNERFFDQILPCLYICSSEYNAVRSPATIRGCKKFKKTILPIIKNNNDPAIQPFKKILEKIPS